jgi:accessory colonization factor AcfC
MRIAALLFILGLANITGAAAAEPLHVYGPGGPFLAMKEAAAAFQRQTGIPVVVTAGPTPQWIGQAKSDADLVFSGSEVMMSGYLSALPDLDPASVTPLYLRRAAILVRPGNPDHVTGVTALMQPGHHILVVDGAGQQGLWEDIIGRSGSIEQLRAFRANIKTFAVSSADAKKAWSSDPSLDAWLIWTIWQVANPALADQVAIEPHYAIWRDAGIALSRRGEARPDARQFAAFLQSPAGVAIFTRWGWQAN